MTKVEQNFAHTPKIWHYLIVFAAIFTVGILAFELPSLGGRLRLPLLPSGLALAATYRWGPKMSLSIFAAGVGIDLALEQPLLASLGVGTGLASGALFSCWLLRRGSFDSGFSRARDVPLFILAVALGMTLAPTFGLVGFFLSGANSFAGNPINWVRWWSNSTSGALLLGPLFMSSNQKTPA